MEALQERYSKEIAPALKQKFSLTNVMRVPRVEKVILSMGLGEALQNAKAIEYAVEHLGLIAGQRPIVTKAKKSIASFKLRQGMSVGVSVTLRRERMYAFLGRLINVALPRVRDFKGLSTKGMDGHGNYSLGIKEQIIFPEIDYDKIDKIRGFNVTIVTSAENDEQGLELLRQLGVPFVKQAR